MITLTATEVVILTASAGTDRIMLTLTLPSGTYPYVGGATATIDVAKGNATAWLKEHFPSIDPEVIKMK